MRSYKVVAFGVGHVVSNAGREFPAMQVDVVPNESDNLENVEIINLIFPDDKNMVELHDMVCNMIISKTAAQN